MQTSSYIVLHSLGGPQQASTSKGKVGGFGFHTSSGGPYTGILALNSAYNTSQFKLSSDRPFVRRSDLLAPVEGAPSGACWIPYVHYSGDNLSFQNSLTVANECATSAPLFYSLDDASFAPLYVFQEGPNSTPTLATATFTLDKVPSSTSVWNMDLYNWLVGTWDSIGTQTGISNLTAGVGGSFYIEDPLGAGDPCPALPTLSSRFVALFNAQKVTWEALAPSMNGGTFFTAFAPPNTSTQTCFVNDNTPTPFYTLSHDNNDWQVSTSFP